MLLLFFSFGGFKMGNQSAKVSSKAKFGEEQEKKSRTNWTAGKTSSNF